MNRHDRKLIRNCEDYKVGHEIKEMLIFNSNKSYNGFWGKNGYNQIIMVVKVRFSDDYYIVDKGYQKDVIDFMKEITFSIDLPKKLSCIRLYRFSSPIKITRTHVSAIAIEEAK